MCAKWTNSQNESGILRKSDKREKKEELFVFGYSCKLFRDDDKALLIDQGKHLIPWMGDESLKIDRYDARGALHELKRLEAPPGGYDWRVELTKTEQEVEQLCDEERYRALHTDEDEEEMYREEELKRLHAAGYGQVGFNYDTTAAPTEPATVPVETDEPFLPTETFKALLPQDIILPESEKQNVIIEKTAMFIATQGAQMEILIKAKQRDNPQFQFLNRDSELYPYYVALTALVKAGKWPEKKLEVIEEKIPENDEYLHPSLAPTIVEAAPSIPSIPYKPSADCDYTLLVCKMRGSSEGSLEGGDIAPPGTEPLPPQVIARAPVRYTAGQPPISPPPPPPPVPYYQRYLAYAHAHTAQPPAAPPPPAPAPTLGSTGLSLMMNYDSDSGSDSDTSSSSSKDKQTLIKPPEDIAAVVDKMAAYVARNGDAFEEIVRAKNDPRFTFLEPSNVYHAYYRKLMMEKRSPSNGTNDQKNSAAPVSFSIKKQKDQESILPKPALPYESSSDEDSEKDDSQTNREENEETNTTPTHTPTPTPIPTPVATPPIVMYKMDASANNIPPVKIIVKPPMPVAVTMETQKIKEVKEQPIEVKLVEEKKEVAPEPQIVKEVKKSPTPDTRVEKVKERKRRESPQVERKRHKDVPKEYEKERRSEKRKKVRDEQREREKKRRVPSKEELEDEIISLVDNSDDMIDLTGDHDQPESKAEEASWKQASRRRRAAEFLRRAGLDPVAASALPHTSLASAMVDTLETIRKKKAEEEEKRRKREKRRQRDRHGYDESDKGHRKSRRRKHRSSDEDGSESESARKRKRKHSKKSSKHKKRREQNIEDAEEEVDHELPPDMDLTSTLKELRTHSPTRELGLTIDNTKESLEESKRKGKKKREDREYSEGEWSSDSDDDSESTPNED